MVDLKFKVIFVKLIIILIHFKILLFFVLEKNMILC